MRYCMYNMSQVQILISYFLSGSNVFFFLFHNNGVNRENTASWSLGGANHYSKFVKKKLRFRGHRYSETVMYLSVMLPKNQYYFGLI